MRPSRSTLAVLALTLLATPAAAEGVHGFAQVRAGLAGGKESWLAGGFGKSAFSADPEIALSQAVVEFRPSFGFAVSGVISLQYQEQASPGLDLNEAFLEFRAPPMDAGRLSARAGVFYPPVSLEHGGVGWTSEDTLSASALNSWIGEEVKVLGLEASFARDFGGHTLSATGAVFGWNDTSGTLLTFRGWALGEVRTGIGSRFELPPLSPFMVPKQAGETYPFLELDNRAGYYGRLEWRTPWPVTFSAFHYDNAGDRIAVDDGQWAWETRFTNLGLVWDVDERTQVLAQGLTGETLMGFKTPEMWVDMGFRAAYVLAAREFAAGTLSGRLDWFDTKDRSWRVADNNDESGWAATAAWRHSVGEHADLLIEAQHIVSDRPSRALAAEQPRQEQTILQSALRLKF